MPVTLRVMLAAIMIFMITIGFLGNAIVCLIVYQKPAMRSAINLLLATLAFSDIMLSLLCMPFTAVTMATADWRFGGGFCRASVMLYWLFVLEGVSILLIISVDRFLIIVQRRQDKLTPHRAKLLIVASWALSLCVALPSVIGWRAGAAGVIGIREAWAPQCVLGYSESLSDRSYTVLLAVAVFFVPFGIMLYSYLCILNTVRRNALRIHNHTSDQASLPALNQVSKLGLTGLATAPQGQHGHELQDPGLHHHPHPLHRLLCVLAAPHCCQSAGCVQPKVYFSPAFYPVSVGALWLSYLKTVFNPVIYCWRIRKFREACLEFMPKSCRLCPRLPGRSRRRVRPSNIYVCSETQSAV
ncbi:hypothetical protein J4Q44_G00370530 [Coregonus suidteri]|uniref:G-protein coupled receptors family 1 profile domain-containing protein n=1 Tax=Coregonus suidteri TaxID=861788 RepID=A0AAN8KMW9_9TELE